MYAIHKQAAAEDDLVDIWQYSFETWVADQADLHLDALNEGIAGLAGNPLRHQIVYYREQADRIDIVRVLHERMDPDRHLTQPTSRS